MPAAFDVTGLPRGIADSTVRAVADGDIAAIVSSIAADEYDADTIERLAGDPAWLAPRALRHDSVVNAVSDRSPVVPLPMWVLFGNDGAVRAMLRVRQTELLAALDAVTGAREYGVRIVVDARALENAARELDTELREVERSMTTASPGQAYLLKRKLAERSKGAVRSVAAQIAHSSHERLAAMARAATTRQLNVIEAPGVILDASYLVENERYDDFRRELTDLVATYGAGGCKFDFTGPWPPYHFVSAA